MQKILWFVFLVLLTSTNAYTDNIKDFKIENISIGDSALDYFTESQLDNSELDWFNYSYKEYSTSLLPGRGIYDWFKITYKNEDYNYIIEGLAGIVVKKNYEEDKCNKQLDSTALNLSKFFKNTKSEEKKTYRVVYDPSKIFQETNLSGKSKLTSIFFDFKQEGKIILSCYDMDKETNEIDSPIKDINQFDTFRIDVRSKNLLNHLKKN
jgi:hypothetical protein|tara:strand:- start:665 stop:1291 length:627 start_codon:yes stop_codon:yes gene_type:complete